jgi:hypothetical protein
MGMELIVCPRCEYENPPQAVFCRQCGYNLRDFIHSSEQTVFVGQATQEDSMSIHQRRAYFRRDGRLLLHIVGTDTVIDCDLSQNTFTLGRKSDKEDDIPHINLTNYKAAELGVSRLHARLTRMNAIIMLEDLATTNGTFVNGERISPGKPCVICHEDEIRLGNLKLQVLFD